MSLLGKQLALFCLFLNTFVGAETPGIHDFLELYHNITSYAKDNDDRIPRQLVRLGFHDAWGGVDGFIDVQDQKHAGLIDVFEFLNTLYDGYQTSTNLLGTLSKADFFSWAYIVGFYYTVPVANIPWVPLRYGRSTFEGSIIDSPEELAPPGYESGGSSRDLTLDYFQSVFGFNEVNTTILMGAHTLGGARRENLGFVDEWTKNQNTFNTEYFRAIVSPTDPQNGWQQVAIDCNDGRTRYQWSWGCNEQNDNSRADAIKTSLLGGEHRLRGLQANGIAGDASAKEGEGKGEGRGRNRKNGCRDLMLNVDMSLFYDIDSYMDEAGKVSLPSNFPEGAPETCGADGIVWAECFPVRESSDSWIVIDYFGGQDEDIAPYDQIFYNAFAEVYGALLSYTGEESTELIEVEMPDIWPPSGFVTGAVQTDPVPGDEVSEIEKKEDTVDGTSEEQGGVVDLSLETYADSSLVDSRSGDDIDSLELEPRDEVEGGVDANALNISNATRTSTNRQGCGDNKLFFVFSFLAMICLSCCGCWKLCRMRKIDPGHQMELDEMEGNGDPEVLKATT